jgi:hypothetical protein
MTQVFEAIEKQWRFHEYLRRTADAWANSRVAASTTRPIAAAVKHLPNVVAVAEPFYWAHDICELLEVAAPSIQTWRPRPEDFITPGGFSWLARPLPLPLLADSRQITMHGFLWVALPDDDYFLSGVIRVTDQGPYVPGGMQFGKWGEDATDLSWADYHGLPEFMRTHDMLQLKYIAAAVLFMSQRLTVHHREPIPRHAMRRVERAGRPIQNEVHVVRLRRAATGPSDRESFPVDWQCRWLVQGHWRNQACGEGRAEQRPVWISPYLKGPESKPLKVPAERLFAVVR